MKHPSNNLYQSLATLIFKTFQQSILFSGDTKIYKRCIRIGDLFRNSAGIIVRIRKIRPAFFPDYFPFILMP